MNAQQKEALKELADCQGVVDSNQYDRLETAVMRELEKEGFCKLAWVITPKGKEEAAK